MSVLSFQMHQLKAYLTCRF